MTNLVKMRYSHAFKCEYFLETGEILPVFLEEYVTDLNPSQRKTLVDTVPLQECITAGIKKIDFSNEIFSYEDANGNVMTFTYEATSSEIYTELKLLVKQLEDFKKEMSADLLKSQEEIKIKVEHNRKKYLGNLEECKKLEWYNPKFFDPETIAFINQSREEVI